MLPFAPPNTVRYRADTLKHSPMMDREYTIADARMASSPSKLAPSVILRADALQAYVIGE